MMVKAGNVLQEESGACTEHPTQTCGKKGGKKQAHERCCNPPGLTDPLSSGAGKLTHRLQRPCTPSFSWTHMLPCVCIPVRLGHRPARHAPTTASRLLCGYEGLGDSKSCPYGGHRKLSPCWEVGLKPRVEAMALTQRINMQG